MATRAGIGRVGVIAVVAGVAVIGDGRVRAGQRVNAVVIKRRRYPSRLAVTNSAVGGELLGGVIGIGRLVVVVGVATRTGVGRVVVVAVVAGGAVVGDGRVGAGQRVIVIVDRELRRLPAIVRVT